MAQCLFNLRVGVQGKQIGVRTLTDFGNNPAYIFPNADVTTVPGLGYPAVLNTHVSGSVHQSTLTVKLGKNALEIHVEWYTDSVNNAFVTQLAKDALARL